MKTSIPLDILEQVDNDLTSAQVNTVNTSEKTGVWQSPKVAVLSAPQSADSVLSDLSFASQNCNSLNISTNCPKQLKKVATILALQTTIIFLSDLRLNSNKVPVENLFSPYYDLYHNSPSSKRGTGKLLMKKLQYTVLNEYRDTIGNILGLCKSISNVKLLVISICGPNDNDINFFTKLTEI
jgi:hypothetical protein